MPDPPLANPLSDQGQPAGEQTPPRASVVIPAYNRRKMLDLVMAHLVRQTVPLSDWELVVVDDGSADGTGEMLQDWQRRYPALRLVYYWQQNRGAAKARNEGIRRSAAPIVCVLDSDAMPAPNWLEELLKGYDEDPQLAGVGGRIFTHQSRGIINEYNLYKKFNEAPGGYGGGEITFLMTGSMSHRRDVLLRVGGFNENYPHFGDDNELGERVRLLGYHYAYNPNSEADHYHRDTFESLLRRFYWLGHGCFDNEMDMATRLTNKTPHRFYLWITRGMFLKNLGALAADLPRRLRERPVPPLRRGVFWALDVLVEIAVWFGVTHFYLARYSHERWDKSFYPGVYHRELGFEATPCPACGGQGQRRFFTPVKDPASEVIYGVDRCGDCGHVFLNPAPPANLTQGPVAPLPSLVGEAVKARVAGELAARARRWAVLGSGWRPATGAPGDPLTSLPQEAASLDLVAQWGELGDQAVLAGGTLKAHLLRVAAALKPGGFFVAEAIDADGLANAWAGPAADWGLPQCREWLGAHTAEAVFRAAGLELVDVQHVTSAGRLAQALARGWAGRGGRNEHPPALPDLRLLLTRRPPQPSVANHQHGREAAPAGPLQGLFTGLLARWLDRHQRGERMVLVARKR